MLQELSIRNFAIIDDLHITFSEGLTMLTGETGAGKSIIINAVNLLLGSRASAGLVRAGAETAELEALFQIASGSPAARNMAQFDLDFSEGLLIRRTISQHEKHRVLINGRLATAQMLSTVTENLASISGQHAHQGLLKEELHLLVLDRFGGLMPLREKVSSRYRELIPLINKFRDLERLRDRRQEQLSLLEFQKNELAQVAPGAGEDEALEKERSRLKNAEMLYQTVERGIDLLYSAQGAVLEQMTRVGKELLRASLVDPDLSPSVNRLTEMTYQIEDICDGLRAYLKRIQINESRMEAVTERLDILNKLKRKYGGTLAAVLSHQAAIESELGVLENVTDEIQATRALLGKFHAQICEMAQTLSNKRMEVAKVFAAKVEKELEDVKMVDTVFEVFLRSVPAGNQTDPHLVVGDALLEETGIDRATFMIAPNVGEALKPLSKIASGGELSRVVLALMAIIAETESVGLVVFDEVDAGIGGGVAEMVGKKMVDLAKYHQIICITHLPQIAKFGDHHYLISKQVSEGRTKTTMLPLDDEERMREIARMLGGVIITPATLDHARELLKK
ncbi:MAG: DNA repair protein RecN [Pseudomonadota bacterium]